MGITSQHSFIVPKTKKVDVIDNYFGTEIPDPYRWLEDDMSEETTAWVKAQNEVTFAYLEEIPFRNQLKVRMSEIWNYPKMGTPGKEAGYYVYSYNTGLQNQDIITIKKDLDGNGRILLDPNTFSDDGTVALAAFRISNNSKYLAYGLSRAGSDWMELYVKEIESGKELRDHLEWIKFSDISWYEDGFFYTRYEEPMDGDKLKGENKNAHIFYHRVGTDQSEDILIHKDDLHPDWGFNLGVTEDEQFMLLSVTESTSGNALAFKKAGVGNQAFTWIAREFHKSGSTNV